MNFGVGVCLHCWGLVLCIVVVFVVVFLCICTMNIVFGVSIKFPVSNICVLSFFRGKFRAFGVKVTVFWGWKWCSRVVRLGLRENG